MKNDTPLTDEQRTFAQQHMALIRSYIRGVYRPGLDADDIESVGNLALCLAARTFDPSRGKPFSSHVWRRFRAELRDETDRMRFIRVPRRPRPRRSSR
jgi:DNA-directed RNA polymerase specialized sigma subunit